MRLRTALVGLMLCTLCAGETFAHHSIAHDFDVGRRVRLEGSIIQFQWMNPHCAIQLAVKRADGVTETWQVEGGPPNALVRRGWTKQTLSEGATIIVNGYPARDGSRRANAHEIQLANGRRLDAASSYLPGKR